MGVCWLQWKKREKYFKVHTAVGEIFIYLFFYCHTPLDSVVFILGILCIFVSNLLGRHDVCQSLFWFAQLFFTKGSLPSGTLSDCALFNGAADWGFTSIQIASREGGKSHPASLSYEFTCWSEVIWPQLTDNSACLAHVKMEAGEEFYLCSSEKLPKTKRNSFFSFLFFFWGGGDIARRSKCIPSKFTLHA